MTGHSRYPMSNIMNASNNRDARNVAHACSRRDVNSSWSSGKSRDSSHRKELEVNSRKSYSNSIADSDKRESRDIL